MFKAIHGIHWQSFIVRKVNGFNDSSAPVQSVTKKIDEVVYFTIASKDNGVKVLSAMENIPETPEGIILESLLEGYEHSNGHNKKSNMD